jgi:hypothetical protein
VALVAVSWLAVVAGWVVERQPQDTKRPTERAKVKKVRYLIEIF